MEFLDGPIGSQINESFRKQMLKYAKNFVDKKKMGEIFAEAGREVADYEKDNTEECQIRQIIFQEENMRQFGQAMYDESPYQFQEILETHLDEILQESALSKHQMQQCKIHFTKIVINEIMKKFQDIYDKIIWQDTYQEVFGIAEGVQKINRQLSEMLQQTKWPQKRERQEHSSSGRYLLSGASQAGKQKRVWKLGYPAWNTEIEEKGTRKEKILQLTETWRMERKQYPGWYIPPFHVCQELQWKSDSSLLLQKNENVTERERMQFAYEYVWRMETGMALYSGYEQSQLRDIWENYRTTYADDWGSLSGEEKEQWFYLGQVLLREYREDGNKEAWHCVYTILEKYKEDGRNGETELEMEQIKFYFMKMDLSRAKKLLGEFHPQKNQYEVRLQAAGLKTELGMEQVALEELKKWWQDISDELNGTNVDETHTLWLESLRVCMLQLYSLTFQGDSWRNRRQEAMQEDINRILEYMDTSSVYFDWEDTLEKIKARLLHWHVNEYRQKEPFELNRETISLAETGNICEEAYLLYRLLDKMALPLQVNHVTLISNLEEVWFEALGKLNTNIFTFMLLRSTSSSNVKNLIGYRRLTIQAAEQVEQILEYLRYALEENLGELDECNVWKEGNIYSSILQNVPQMLIRYMVRCPEKQQTEMLGLIKKMLDLPGFDLNSQMNIVITSVVQNVTEHVKAEMLGTMLESGMYDRNVDHGWRAVTDVFDFYLSGDVNRLKRWEYRVSESQVKHLIQKAAESKDTWKLAVTRLRVLHELKLLNDEQERQFADILWSHINPETRLPDIPDLYRWVYIKLPHPEHAEPVAQIKKYFLQTELTGVLQDKNGCSITMGEVPYLDELLALLGGVKNGFWTISEIEKLLLNMKQYWDADKGKLKKAVADRETVVGKEYRMRFRKVIRVCSELYQSTAELCSENVLHGMTDMIMEMEEVGLKVLQLKLLFFSEKELGSISESVIGAFYSADESETVDAVVSAGICCRKNPNTALAKRFVWELINFIRTRKEPGLMTALGVMYNILYRDDVVLTDKETDILDTALYWLAGQMDYHKLPEEEKVRKRAVEVRVSAARLAYRLYLKQKRGTLSKGVAHWKEICESEWELSAVKNSWKG
uniref:hypothetical protein n=1 Tax=Roseburia sp. TaxID=2049040 RepID=UPI003FEEFCE0